MTWDDIDPELLAFVRDPVPKDPSPRPENFLPEEMQQSRKEWNAFVAGQRQAASEVAPASPEPDAPSGKGPERFIGPRNPDHPGVNRDKGGRDPS